MSYIQQANDVVITFKLYADEALNTDFVASFNCLNSIKSGELYLDDFYYILSGIAADGVEHVGEARPFGIRSSVLKWRAQHDSNV